MYVRECLCVWEKVGVCVDISVGVCVLHVCK